jgi:hypothetical protein
VKAAKLEVPNWYFKLSRDTGENCNRFGKTFYATPDCDHYFGDPHGSRPKSVARRRPRSDLRRTHEGAESGGETQPGAIPRRLHVSVDEGGFENLKSQFVTSSSHGGRRKLPFAFTENGAVMAAYVLNSPAAVRMGVFVVRAFLQMRELLGGTKELARQLADLEKKLTARLDGHEVAIVEVLRRVMDMLDPPPLPEPPKRQIGFHVRPDDERPAKARRKS